MATTVHSPVTNFNGKVAGVAFVDGKGKTDNPNALAYFRRHGYGIGAKPAVTAPAPSPQGPAQTSTSPPVDAANHPELTPTTTTPVGQAGGPFDPGAHSVEEVNAHIEAADDAERDRVLAAESEGKARKGVLEGPHAPSA